MSKHRDAHQLGRVNAQIEHITKSLKAIGTYYDHVLSSPVAADECELALHDAKSGEPVRVDLLDARMDCERDLRSWVRFVLNEVNGGTITTNVSTGILDMVTFLARWTPAIVEQHPDDADNLERETRQHAERLESLARGWVTRRIEVGRCPEQILVQQQDAQARLVEVFVPCTGTLWALMRSQDTLLPQAVRCDQHGHEWAPWQWHALGRRIVPIIEEEAS